MHLETSACSESGTAPEWVALGASVTGTSHIARSLPCQDAHGGVVLADGTLLLAVADGAGSARYSDQGSLHAVQASIRALANGLAAGEPENDATWRALLYEALHEAQTAVEERALEIDGATPRDLATTLLLAVITPRWLTTLQVGDGAVVLRSGAALYVLSPPPTGEYINETTFITAADAQKSALISVNESGPVDGLALLTDGVQFLALEYNSNTAHAPFFKPLFDFAAQSTADPEELKAMLGSDRVNELTDDDKTLVLAVRVTGAASQV